MLKIGSTRGKQQTLETWAQGCVPSSLRLEGCTLVLAALPLALLSLRALLRQTVVHHDAPASTRTLRVSTQMQVYELIAGLQPCQYTASCQRVTNTAVRALLL